MVPMDGDDVIAPSSTGRDAVSTLLRRRRAGDRKEKLPAAASSGRPDETTAGAAESVLPDVPAESVACLLPGSRGAVPRISEDDAARPKKPRRSSDICECDSDDAPSVPAGELMGTSKSSEGELCKVLGADGGSVPFLPSYPIVTHDIAAELTRIDMHFKFVAVGSVLAFVFLAALCYTLTPSENIERVAGVERSAAIFAFALLLLNCLGRLLPLFYSDVRSLRSGLLMCSLVVQCVALMTDAVMAFAPTPVMIDPVLGTRVHLLRWCEWTPLAFAMTFMTEGIDVPRKGQHLGMHYANAWCQGVSTFMGLLFPLAPGIISWSFLMLVSCVLFLSIFPRLKQKRSEFLKTKRGTNVDEVELFDRVRLSYQLLYTCTAVWTLLVIMYFIAGLGPRFGPEGSFLTHSALTMITEASMDVITKSLFMGIIVSVHDLVFNDTARAERRLEELRQMMSVVWESSSDVIVISVRGISGDVTTMLSPTYLRMYQGKGGKLAKHGSAGKADESGGPDLRKPTKAVVFNLEASELEPHHDDGDESLNDDCSSSQDLAGEASQGSLSVCSRGLYNPQTSPRTTARKRVIHPKMVHEVQFTGLSTFGSSSTNGGDRGGCAGQKMRSHITKGNSMTSNDELSSMADLVVEAWGCQGESTLLMHDLVRLDKGTASTIRCEATVNRLEENALVIVMRDISERFKRFEAEKLVVSETTARMKDAEANRFTRHEVKNGLLAAIGLCDSLKETLSGPDLNDGIRRGSAGSTDSADVHGLVLNQLAATDASRCVVELDKALNEILDTVLSEAMARDVIHEAYEPKMERVNIMSLLSSTHGAGDGGSKASRFPIITDPVPLPMLMFDPQLLKYIHRNAISNACKYGKKGGVVTTMIRFDEDRGELEMDVMNLPGEHHNEILKLGDRARDAVFSPGKRLHQSFHNWDYNESLLVSHSSGDGAWIMQKCARTLGGECDIQFDRSRTVFSFRCPATAFEEAMKTTAALEDATDFQVPTGSWGIALDDSKIQRKLLRRFLRIAGVEEERCIVLGRGRAEIEGFDDMVVQLIDHHPNEYFLLIVDENLDIMEGQTCHKTISGSLLIENIRHRLLPDQERRMLALVRSANDSSHDVAIYNSRAHGYVPKAPVERDHVLELLAPLWQKRHLYKPSCDGHSSDGSELSSNPRGSVSDEDAEAQMEITMTLDSINELTSTEDEAVLEERWPLIWEKLHGLKGDLMTLFESPTVGRTVSEISALRGTGLPHNFSSKWTDLRSLVQKILSDAAEKSVS